MAASRREEETEAEPEERSALGGRGVGMAGGSRGGRRRTGMSALRGDSASARQVIQSAVIAIVRWRAGTPPGGTSDWCDLWRLRNGPAGGRCGRLEREVAAGAMAVDH
jgi:hypothetical protein